MPIGAPKNYRRSDMRAWMLPLLGAMLGGWGCHRGTCPGGCLAPDTCGGGGVADRCAFSPSLCDRFASPAGSDGDGAGSIASPYRTAQKLADSLAPGQVGCLRGNAG